MELGSRVILIASSVFLGGCATTLPRPETHGLKSTESLNAVSLFEDSLEAHGGDIREQVDSLNVSISGEWGRLIKKIQPLVTDFGYRIDSEERFLPRDQLYAVRWNGPAGEKVVIRRPEETRVFYNGQESDSEDVLASSALTSDAFTLFHFGPSFLKWRGSKPVRLTDYREEDREFYRLYFEIEPGFGRSPRDEVVLYIDKETNLMHRVWITLEGYRTTKGATVDVTFLEYEKVGGLRLPTHFLERVRAPISIYAHEWKVLGWEVNRPYDASDLRGPEWSGSAAELTRQISRDSQVGRDRL